MSCPGDAELGAFLDGSLAPQMLVSLEAHVAGCDECALLVAHLGALGDPGPGIVGGRYRIESLVGRGGMGEVWSAFDPELERRVAVKLIRAQLGDAGSKRLVREARALAKLQDANVVAVYDVGESDGEMYVVTELVDGETLEEWQRERPSRDVIDAYLQAARGLAAAHQQELVHRDIKPSNLFVGSDGRVRVGDFGLAIAAGAPNARGEEEHGFTTTSRATEVGRVAGTPAYMAPEQRGGGEADARADQFSLAVSLAEAIGGARPKAGARVGELSQCGAIAPVLARSLAAAKADRYPDMTAWIDAIEAARRPRPSRRNKVTVALVALVALVAIASVGALAVALTSSRASSVAADEGVVATRLSVDASQVPSPGRDASAADAAHVRRAKVVAASRPRPAQPTVQPTKPPPKTSPQVSGTDALEAADQALKVGNTSACLASITSVSGLTGRQKKQATVIRARCEMLSGDCRAGSARLATLSDKAHVAAEADAYCRPDRGEIATRMRRLYVQVSIFAMQRRFGCSHYEKSALAAAAHAKLGSVPQGKPKLASVFNNLADCHAKADRCSRAETLLAKARSHGLGVIETIPGCFTP